MDEYFRNANIALAAGIPLLVVGVIAFGMENEGILLLLLLVTFATMGIVKARLDNRTLRRRQGRWDQ